MTKTSLSTTALTAIAAFPRDTALAISSPPTRLAPPATFDHSPPTLIAPHQLLSATQKIPTTSVTTTAATSTPPASSTPAPPTPTPPPTPAAAAAAVTATPSTAPAPASCHPIPSAPLHATTSSSTSAPARHLSKSVRKSLRPSPLRRTNQKNRPQRVRQTKPLRPQLTTRPSSTISRAPLSTCPTTRSLVPLAEHTISSHQRTPLATKYQQHSSRPRRVEI